MYTGQRILSLFYCILCRLGSKRRPCNATLYCDLHLRWQATAGREGEAVHVNHNVTNFEFLYEPFYVAPDTVPAHDERFIGYGYTRNTQVRLFA